MLRASVRLSKHMPQISYHISHEQFSPKDLITLIRHAESAGFDAAFSSDHIQPWSPAQGQSGFLWAWLGAALQATRQLKFSAITIPGGWRYHPVVLAQAMATLSEMFPGRLPWVALGSGEALNECVVGSPWPPKPQRNRRLREGAQIIHRLLRGETVTQAGPPAASEARLWTRTAETPHLVAAAMSESTAEWAGSWAEGLLTIAPSLPKLAAIVKAFQRQGHGKPMHLKVDLSWAPTESEALAQAHEQWRVQLVNPAVASALRRPEQFDAASRAMCSPRT